MLAAGGVNTTCCKTLLSQVLEVRANGKPVALLVCCPALTRNADSIAINIRTEHHLAGRLALSRLLVHSREIICLSHSVVIHLGACVLHTILAVDVQIAAVETTGFSAVSVR